MVELWRVENLLLFFFFCGCRFTSLVLPKNRSVAFLDSRSPILRGCCLIVHSLACAIHKFLPWLYIYDNIHFGTIWLCARRPLPKWMCVFRRTESPNYGQKSIKSPLSSNGGCCAGQCMRSWKYTTILRELRRIPTQKYTNVLDAHEILSQNQAVYCI